MSNSLLLAAMASGAPGAIQTIPNVASGLGDAEIRFANDGGIRTIEDGVTDSTTYDWVLPATAAIAAQWEIKIDATSGSFTGGTTGTWLALSSSRDFSKAAGGGSVTYTASFRPAGQVVATKVQAGITLSA